MVEIDEAMKFITEKLERNTIPIRLTYSMASLAASMKRIADRVDGINGGVNVSTSVSFYQIEQKLGEIVNQMRSLPSPHGELTQIDMTLRRISDVLNDLHSVANNARPVQVNVHAPEKSK